MEVKLFKVTEKKWLDSDDRSKKNSGNYHLSQCGLFNAAFLQTIYIYILTHGMVYSLLGDFLYIKKTNCHLKKLLSSSLNYSVISKRDIFISDQTGTSLS